jgi:hypothetical protein
LYDGLKSFEAINFAAMKKMNFSTKYITLFVAVIILSIIVPSCKNNPMEVDISGVEVALKSKRLDRDLFRSAEKNFNSINASLQKEYGIFYTHYLAEIIRIGLPTDPMIAVQLEHFVQDPNWQETQKQIDIVFADAEPVSDQFEEAFRYYKYHFHEAQIPELVFYNSGFNVGVYPTSTHLGVGLEWFLGVKNPVVQRLAPERFPQYLKDKLDKKYMAVNAIKGWMMVNHQNILPKEDIISMMIFHGKMMYLVDAVFPRMDEETKMNYTTTALEWCKTHEYNVWTYLIENKVLYSTNPKELAGFFNDGPFTPGISQESPARVGIWMGWQIVRQYMKKNPEVTLQQLLQEQNHQKILKYYKPR